MVSSICEKRGGPELRSTSTIMIQRYGQQLVYQSDDMRSKWRLELHGFLVDGRLSIIRVHTDVSRWILDQIYIQAARYLCIGNRPMLQSMHC